MERQTIVIKAPLAVAHGRSILEGASEYARNRRDWWLTVLNEEANPDDIRSACPSGVIAFNFKLSDEEALLDLGVPVVSVANIIEGSRLPGVYFDDFVAGELAAAHLMECALANYAFVGDEGARNARLRLDGYRAKLEAEGHSVIVLSAMHSFGGWIPFNPDEIIRQLKALPKPVGVFAPWDLLAYHVARVCEHAQLKVPEEIAIIGVDNDALICNVTRPPLTSVRIPAFEIGYAAAKLLDELLRGEPAPEAPLLLPPSPPVVRQSTQLVAVADEKVARTLTYMREHAHESIGISQLWEALGFERKDLETRFRRALGRSPGQEFTRVRVERAKQLVLDTSYTTEELARACGFATASYLVSVFRKHVGVTPQRYRERFRQAKPQA
jgi:LacI family transcriptional regulator